MLAVIMTLSLIEGTADETWKVAIEGVALKPPVDGRQESNRAHLSMANITSARAGNSQLNDLVTKVPIAIATALGWIHPEQMLLNQRIQQQASPLWLHHIW
jgi:hypothetical protein